MDKEKESKAACDRIDRCHADDLINQAFFESLGESEAQDHHPEPPDDPKDRVIRLTFNFDIAQVTLEEAQDLAAELENAGCEIKAAWEDGRLPKGCDVFSLVPDSCEVFIEKK